MLAPATSKMTNRGGGKGYTLTTKEKYYYYYYYYYNQLNNPGFLYPRTYGPGFHLSRR